MEVKTIDPRITPKVAPNFAKNLRQVMDSREISAAAISEKSGIPTSSIYRFLDPKYSSDPTASTMLKLCHALGCELADLISL
jgi:DNA-binding Xre family transcriptional regulator